ncbi:hypothetical protein ACFLWM_01955 [Chloroflexota bacterium]
MSTKNKDRLGLGLMITGIALPIIAVILSFTLPTGDVGITMGVIIKTVVGGIAAIGFGAKLRRDAAREEYTRYIKKMYGDDAEVIFK